MRFLKRLMSICGIVVISTAVSVIGFLFIFFAVFETWPELLDKSPFDSIRYFAVQRGLEPDPVLVFRNRPFREVNSMLGEAFAQHPVLGVNLEVIPYHGTLGEFGLRPSSPPGPGDQWDVVVVGDSFIESGHRDDNTFTALLAAATGTSVRNLGVSWYGPQQYLEMYKRLGVTAQPKIAIWAFFEGNDIKDMVEYERWQKTGKYYFYEQGDKGFLGRFPIFLKDFWKFVSKMFFEKVRKPIAQLRGRYIDGLLQQAMQIDDGHQRFWHPIDIANEKRSHQELLSSPEWQRFREILGGFHELNQKNNIRSVCLFLPTARHIYGPYSTEKSGDYWRSISERENKNRGNREAALKMVCEELGLHFVSAVPLLEQLLQSGVRPYYPADGHWSAEGRMAVAEFLREQFTSWGVL